LPYEKWASGLSPFLGDNMPFRSQLIRKYIQIWEGALHSYVRARFPGRDGELYTSYHVRVFLGLHPTPKKSLYAARAKIAGSQAYWEERGVPYVFVIFPRKPSVYSEYLPFGAGCAPRGSSPREDWVAALNGTPINFIDMTDVLVRHKKEYKSFNKVFDTNHWNGYGVYLAYRTICEALSSDKLPLKTLSSGNDYEIANREIRGNEGGSAYWTGNEIPTFEKEIVPWMYLLKIETLKIVPHNLPNAKRDWDGTDVTLNGKAQIEGAMACFSNSYFKATHGTKISSSIGEIMPFAHHFKTFISTHCNYSTFTIAERVASEYNPVAVVEGLPENWGYPENRDFFKFMQMGEIYLQSPTFVFYPDRTARQAKPRDVSFSLRRQELVLSVRGRESYLELPAVETGEEGRAVLIGTLHSPAKTRAHVRYSRKDGKTVNEDIPLNVGSNDVYVQLFDEPHAAISARFYPGDAKGEYKFLPLPDLKRIEHNLRDEEYLKNRFALDRERLANAYFPIGELKTSKDLSAATVKR
jgi:hypothetical protein